MLGIEGSDKAKTGGAEHHALNCHIDHTATLAQHTGQSTKGNRGRETNALAQDPQDLKPSPHAGPDQNDDDEPDRIEREIDGV